MHRGHDTSQLSRMIFNFAGNETAATSLLFKQVAAEKKLANMTQQDSYRPVQNM